MDGNQHPDPMIKREKVINLATTSVDQALELIRLLPTPLQIDEGSKLYKSLAEMRRVVVSTIDTADVGTQADFTTNDPKPINTESDISDEYVMVNVASNAHVNTEKHADIEMERPNRNNFETDKSIATKHAFGLDELGGTVSELRKPENEEKLQDKGTISVSNKEYMQKTYLDNDEDTIHLKSNNSALQHEDYTDCNDKPNTSDETSNEHENETLQASVATPNDPGNSNIKTNITVAHAKTKNDSKEETITQDKSNMSPEMIVEDKTVTETSELISSRKYSILDLVKPKDYKLKPREKVTVFGNWEDCKKLLRIASEAMLRQDYVRAKRAAEKSERIRPTPAGRALIKQIRIVTEAREKAASLDYTFSERARDVAAWLDASYSETAQKAAVLLVAEKDKEAVIVQHSELRKKAQRAAFDEKAKLAAVKEVISADKVKKAEVGAALLAAEKAKRAVRAANKEAQRAEAVYVAELAKQAKKESNAIIAKRAKEAKTTKPVDVAGLAKQAKIQAKAKRAKEAKRAVPHESLKRFDRAFGSDQNARISPGSRNSDKNSGSKRKRSTEDMMQQLAALRDYYTRKIEKEAKIARKS